MGQPGYWGRPAPTPAVAARMAAQAVKNTGPERRLAEALRVIGLRPCRHHRLPYGRRGMELDFAWLVRRVGVVVNGCYWHGCVKCAGAKAGPSAGEWARKIEQTRARDARNRDLAADRGWRVVTVWEHEDPAEAARRIAALLRAGEKPANGLTVLS